MERALFIFDLIQAEIEKDDDYQVLEWVMVLVDSLQNQLNFIPELINNLRES